jgi:Xaa-Pro aminopeptidase
MQYQDDRKKTYLNILGAERPLRSPVSEATLRTARAWRQRRLREKLAAHDCAALLLTDPVNIRYATDVSNMQVWHLHNALRYTLLCAGGPTIAFEYKGSEHLVRGFETVDEIRPATAIFYYSAGCHLEERAHRWAQEIAAEVRRHGGGNLRLAVDKAEPIGIAMLMAEGLTVVEGQELTEHARCIKSPEELELIAWTIRVCEAGMARMYRASEPGRAENEIWAELHYENIRNGGEWIETRLLAAGPRTNPWFQECSDYRTRQGEILAFDTDLIGPYGYCADLSRTWTIGHTPPTPEQKQLYGLAREQIEHNLALLKAGVTAREFNERSWRIPDRYAANRCSVALHGVGLADEYPSLPTHLDFGRAYDSTFEAGMTVCVESYIGAEGGREGVKLETQVLIGENGAERLDAFPWEDWA